MFSSLAITDCFIFLASLSFLITVLFMAGIVLIFKTLVKMKNDKIIASQIGSRLKEFRIQTLKLGTQRLAKIFNEDHPEEPIRRSHITNWENSPGWEYLFWLEKRCKLNLIWALTGKPDRPLKV